jgi:hypothetical protein
MLVDPSAIAETPRLTSTFGGTMAVLSVTASDRIWKSLGATKAVYLYSILEEAWK